MRATTNQTARLAIVLLVGLAATCCRAGDRGPGTNLGVHFGYFTTLGDWTQHRYAPGVDLLQGSFTFGGELELRFLGLHAGIFADYTRLRTKEWEDYARSQGDDVSASASMANYGVRFKYYFASSSPTYANVSLGVGGYDLRGHESFGGRTYDYDFLAGGAGIVVGCGFKRELSPQVAVTAEARAIFVIEGMKYADGEVRDVIGAPLTIGLCYLF
jgi:hypothetical protein